MPQMHELCTGLAFKELGQRESMAMSFQLTLGLQQNLHP